MNRDDQIQKPSPKRARKRGRGLKADYGGATPEEVARAVFGYRPPVESRSETKDSWRRKK